MGIEKSRPAWCEDKTCLPLCSADTKGGGQCIGKLAEATDHITPKVNFMSRCHYDRAVGKISGQFANNLEDIIVEVYIDGEALRAQGLGLPEAIIDNLPRKK
mgnify:CR=1 FL=1